MPGKYVSGQPVIETIRCTTSIEDFASEKDKVTSDTGCLEGETRATFIVNKKLLAKFKKIAYWERIQIKEAIQEALEKYIATKLEE